MRKNQEVGTLRLKSPDVLSKAIGHSEGAGPPSQLCRSPLSSGLPIPLLPSAFTWISVSSLPLFKWPAVDDPVTEPHASSSSSLASFLGRCQVVTGSAGLCLLGLRHRRFSVCVWQLTWGQRTSLLLEGRELWNMPVCTVWASQQATSDHMRQICLLAQVHETCPRGAVASLCLWWLQTDSKSFFQ